MDVNSIPNPSPGDYRPQVDVVLYRKDLPKISYSQTDAAYFVEGVMATIESKSVLTEAELNKVNDAALKHAKLSPTPFTGVIIGRQHERMYKYVIAYDGPESMKTVAGWMQNYLTENRCWVDDMVDMIIVLGKGVLWRLGAFPELSIEQATPANYWACIDQEDKNVLPLFIHMLTWIVSSSSPPNMFGYLSKVQVSGIILR